MTSKKHLVLDEDVHEALLQRRELTGLPISRTGNGILRSHIRAALHERLLGEELVEGGHITWEQYETILENVNCRARARRRSGPVPVERVGQGEFIAGSWKIEVLFDSPVGAFQLLECWARDPHMHPLSQHSHAAEEYLIGLDGRCVVVMKGIPTILSKGCVFRIPDQVIHSATPLGQDMHLLAIMVPAVREYSAGKWLGDA